MQSMLALLHSLQETITSASMCDTGGVNAGKAKVEALAAIGYVIFKLCQLFVSAPKHLHKEVVDLHNEHGVIVLLNLFASLGTGLVAAIRQNCSFVHILDMRELYVCVLNHLRSQKNCGAWGHSYVASLCWPCYKDGCSIRDRTVHSCIIYLGR